MGRAMGKLDSRSVKWLGECLRLSVRKRKLELWINHVLREFNRRSAIAVLCDIQHYQKFGSFPNKAEDERTINFNACKLSRCETSTKGSSRFDLALSIILDGVFILMIALGMSVFVDGGYLPPTSFKVVCLGAFGSILPFVIWVV